MYSDALLLAAAQHVHPVGNSIPSTFAFLDVGQLDKVEIGEQVVIFDALADHVLISVRVDNLIPQGSQRHVGPLRNVEQFSRPGFGQSASKHRPQLELSIRQNKTKTIIRLNIIF